eukprot:4931968-Amphidinium_carterae.1
MLPKMLRENHFHKIDCICCTPKCGHSARLAPVWHHPRQVFGMPALCVVLCCCPNCGLWQDNAAALVHAHRGHDASWHSKYLHFRSLIVQHAINRQTLTAS